MTHPTPMTANEIAAMQADALAGRKGNWVVFDWMDKENRNIGIQVDGDFDVCAMSNTHSTHTEVDARRIARIPRLEATITAQAAELTTERQAREAQAARIAELEEALTSIGRQELTCEMSRVEGGRPEGDFEYAYDLMVKIARASLEKKP